MIRSCSGSIRGGAGFCRSTACTCRGASGACCGAASFRCACDTAFEAVIRGCAEASETRPTTWINDEIVRLYTALFAGGAAHSVECWHDGELVGGLYGVSLGAAFFGESMFSRVTDASKIALVHLVARLRLGRLRAARHAVRDAASGAVRRCRDQPRPLPPPAFPGAASAGGFCPRAAFRLVDRGGGGRRAPAARRLCIRAVVTS